MTTWTYPACTVVGVHDGDTIEVDIDYGRDTWALRAPVRIFGIAARELRAPGGAAAREHLAGLLPLGTSVRIVSIGWDKYGGRIDGSVVRIADELDVSVEMIASGYAAPWNGRGTQPQPPWPIPTTD